MGARQGDASTAVSAFDGNDERTQAGAVGVVLAGNLFGIGKNGLEIISQLHDGHTRVAGLLNDACNDLAGLAGKVTQYTLIVGVTQALHNDRTRCGLGDAAKVLRGVVKFSDGVAIIIFFGGHHGDAAGALINFDASL